MLEILGRIVPVVLVGVCFRAIPFAGYALCSSRVGRVGKAGALASSAVLAYAGARLHPHPVDLFISMTLAWSYLAAAAVLVYAATRWWRKVEHTNAGMMFSAGALFLLTPGLLLRSELTVYVVAAGFELVFSAYSYWKEFEKPNVNLGPLGECVTFLLVNPALVFAARGREVSKPGIPMRGIGRLVLGLFGISATSVMLVATMRLTPEVAAWAGARGPFFVAVLGGATLTVQLYSEYIAHSSVAHFQIGAMRILGYELPERYHYPFLARSPEDFWRRWNIYLGAWLQRYVYLPLAAHYQRRTRSQLWPLAKGGALFVTFTVCGLMHEAAGYAFRFQFPIGTAVAFSAFGLVLGAWVAARQLAVGMLPRVVPGARRALGLFGGVISWTLCMSLLLAFGAVMLPALDGQGLSPVLVGWLLR